MRLSTPFLLLFVLALVLLPVVSSSHLQKIYYTPFIVSPSFYQFTSRLNYSSFTNIQIILDSDEDGVTDKEDNCPRYANTRQKDRDKDGIGDACDNCPFVFNFDQVDSNNNFIGDVCDLPDQDYDGVPDSRDNCINVSNPNQSDSDKDGIGDVCD